MRTSFKVVGTHPAATYVFWIVAAAVTIGVGVAVSPLIAAGALGIVALAVAVRGSEAVLHLIVGSVFVESVAIRVHWQDFDLGNTLRVGRVVALGALLIVAVRVLFSYRRSGRVPSWSWVPVVLFGVWALVSGFWATSLGGWAIAMFELGLAGCVYLAFAFLLDSPDALRRVFRTYVFGAMAAVMLGVMQTSNIGRALGLQGDPNLYAMYQVLAVPVALTLGRSTVGIKRMFWYGATAPIAASVLLSQSRGGVIALLVVMAIVMFRRDGAFIPRGWRPIAFSFAAVGLVALLVSVGPALMQRFDPATIGHDRGSDRLDIWHVAWNEFLDHPVAGMGAGTFKRLSVALLEEEPGVELSLDHRIFRGTGVEVHNIYLEALTEQGILGLAVLLLLLIATAHAVRRFAKSAPTTVMAALPPMLAAIATATFFISTVNNKMLWAVIGIVAGLAAHERFAPDVIEDER
jgi:O-antigen ligase